MTRASRGFKTIEDIFTHEGTLAMEKGLPYSDFLSWALTGDLDAYYADNRWPDWREQVAPLSGDQGILVYPPLWAAEGGERARRSKNVVPVTELWGLTHEWRNQLGLTAG